ncbi:hypothetical protein B0H11DRAFT_2257926 [Mycena galericulata]|nr:hypothetical protein B0H11DRAFT_2257926 [Mycena galericulata]
MPKGKARIISPSYWQDVQRRRQLRNQRATPTMVPFEQELLLQDQHPVYTFTRNHAYMSVVKADGTKVTTPLGPPLTNPTPPPPPRTAPARRKLSPIQRRAQALLDARPSPDEVLLARLAPSRASGSQSARPAMKYVRH